MDRIVDAVVEFLDEVYAGPERPSTWFINNEPNSGLLGTVNSLSSEEASTPIVENGTTIAAHVEHLRWSVSKANSLIRGGSPEMNWSESWRVRRVNSEEWESLKKRLKVESDLLIQHLNSRDDWTHDERLKEVLALIPHAAYHLGAIRQMSLILK